jgi:hypothetical protein
MADSIHDRITKAAREQQEVDAEKLNEKIIEFQSQLFDKAATYNNIVVTLGFAGFLALWSGVREFLHPIDAVLVAILLGFSLFLFVLWNVVSSFVNSQRYREYGKIISRDISESQKLKAIVDAERKLKRAEMRYMSAYYVIFFLSAVTGFVAGSLLLMLTGLRLVNHQWSLYAAFRWFGAFY